MAIRNQGTAGLVKAPYRGGKPKLTVEQKSELARIITSGPEESGFRGMDSTNGRQARKGAVW